MPVRTFPSFTALTVLLAAAGSVWAGDNTLYDAPPPDDAAFLRWIEPAAAPVVLGVPDLGQEGDAFHPVSAARTDGARAGVFYTAAMGANGEVVLIEEPARADRTKVLLTLVNLSEDTVRLVLPDQEVAVVGDTSINSAAARAVNPVAVTLEVETADGRSLGAFEVSLRRGQNLTFVARPDGADLIENRFGATLGGS
ncbi:alginate O-acetyltransferase AlgF [Dinoroseobacter sp. PD6]|uniref:alginate O-acetyltransferase AlgF n=1 Tax=Dinoroseobacter sp. PD6 TaxID=3028384 RepID=UPI00237BE684|nr:alginate O-acetyltransferase AlgF [Dinoroseobacter sp. PD6]MDD9715258.1 alginate O-acetyltransferase AlgF [Dinoroseobacter sp. PD6]